MLIIIIFISIAAILGITAISYHNHLKTKAKECAKEAIKFHEQLQQLTDPSHLFTDKEMHRLKREYAPLLNAVNKLYDNPFISKEYLDELGLGDFLEERRLVNHQQYLNNINQSPETKEN